MVRQVSQKVERQSSASGMNVDSGNVGQGLPIPLVELPAPVDPVPQVLELGPTERSQDVGQPVVVADLGVLVVGRRLAGLGGQIPGPLGQVGVGGDQHAPAAGGDDLVAVEAEHGGRRRTNRPAGRR